MSTDKLDPVVFKLGAALYICQIFESSLILLHELIDEDESIPGKTVRFGADYSKKTLGRLINLLKPRIDVPEGSMDFIYEAIDIRNEIVHGYMTTAEHMSMFETEEGRLALFSDLDTKLNAVRTRDIAVCELIDRYLAKYGTSTDKLKQWAEEHSSLYESD